MNISNVINICIEVICICDPVVHVNLKEANFIPGKKNYERVLKCLTEHVSLTMNFLIAWEPKGECKLFY